MPAFDGLGAGMGMGMPPMGAPPMGMPGGDPMAQDALSAMDALSPKGPNPTEGLAKVHKALSTAHRLIMSVLPQVSQWNSQLARDLHKISAYLTGMRTDLQKEAEAIAPPPMLGMMGAPGPAGLPGGGAGGSFLK